MAVSERKRAYNRVYYQRKRDELRAKQADYYRRNAESIRERVARNRIVRPESPEAHRERSRAYYLRKKGEDPRYYAERRAHRRAREAAAAIGEIDFDAVLVRDRGRCHICGGEVRADDLEFDHYIPLFRGGAHSNANLRVAHLRCNRSKGTRLPEELAA